MIDVEEVFLPEIILPVFEIFWFSSVTKVSLVVDNEEIFDFWPKLGILASFWDILGFAKLLMGFGVAGFGKNFSMFVFIVVL